MVRLDSKKSLFSLNLFIPQVTSCLPPAPDRQHADAPGCRAGGDFYPARWRRQHRCALFRDAHTVVKHRARHAAQPVTAADADVPAHD